MEDRAAVLYRLFEELKDEPNAKIDARIVRDAAAGRDLDVQGVVLTYIAEPEFFERIDPPYDPAEFEAFLLAYYARCIDEDPDDEWSDSRYSAAWGLQSWFLSIFERSGGASPVLGVLKGVVADLYQRGDREIAAAVVDGVLAPCFAFEPVKALFEDWREAPALAAAFREAEAMASERIDDGGEAAMQGVGLIRRMSIIDTPDDE